MTRSRDEREGKEPSIELDDTAPRGVSSLGVAVTSPAPLSVSSSSRRAATPAFADGDALAGRYRIVRFVAQGGMGEVYEAEDLELRERVALKTVRSEIVEETLALERFRREIQLARKVTHPNVCRIFDVGFHVTDAGLRIPFLTMELLAGETLMARIRREGPLSIGAALPILRQMAAGLDAAHRAGVIHRDFKSENVFLVGDRAVVTDFGLARGAALTGDPLAHAITGVGIVGSPGYMAPEQVEGGDVQKAADIYALGVVLYEMLTGHLPFVGETPLQTAVKRLKETPLSPRVYVPDLDPDWESAILRCLARDADRRPASAEDVVRIVTRDSLAPPAPSPEAPRWPASRKTALAIAIGLCAGLGVVGLGIRHRLHQGTSAAQAARAGRQTVAVLGFKNLSGRGDTAWISTALVEMLRSELAAGDRLRTVSEEDVVRMKMELGLGDADSFGAASLARIRTILGADYVLVGSYLALGEGADARLRVDLRLQDTALGETVMSVTDGGTGRELIDLASRTGGRLRARLGAPQLSTDDAVAVRAMLPADPDATRLYAEGLEHLRRHDYLVARDLLVKSVSTDPDHPLARIALSEAWSALHHTERAREEARRAHVLSARLPRQDRMRVEASYAEINSDWARAEEIYRNLHKLFPDDIGNGLALARVLNKAGRPRDALAVLAELHKLPAPASNDPMIDLSEARAFGHLGDRAADLAASRRAAEKARAQGARLILAQALLWQASSLWDSGEQQAAQPLFDEAREIFAAAGDRSGVARVHNMLGAALYNQHGDLLRARREFEASLAIQRDIGDQNGASLSLMNLASIRADEGDAKGAREAYQEALAGFRETGDRPNQKLLLFNLGSVLQDLGDLPASKSALEESLAIARKLDSSPGIADALYGLAGFGLMTGDLAAARRAAEEALAIQEKLGMPSDAAITRVALADIMLEEGHADDAERIARAAASTFRAEKSVDHGALADMVIARCLLARGRIDEARDVAARAHEAAARAGNTASSALASIASARVRTAAGDPAGAAGDLAALDVSRVPLVIRLEVRLALGEAELAAGRTDAGRARLSAIEKEARASGFGLVARKAATSRRSRK